MYFERKQVETEPNYFPQVSHAVKVIYHLSIPILPT